MLSCSHSDDSLLSCAVSSDDQMIVSASANMTAKVVICYFEFLTEAYPELK